MNIKIGCIFIDYVLIFTELENINIIKRQLKSDL